MPSELSAPQIEHGLALWLLLWARAAPLFLVAPWLVVRAAPSLLGFALSAGAACALLPLVLPGHSDLALTGLPLMAAGLRELTRGAVLALGCALPITVFESAGAWADSLRGASFEGSALGKLYAWAALALALFASAHLGVVRLFIDTLQSAPLGADLAGDAALRGALTALTGWIVQAFELGVRLSAPLLLAAWVIALLFGLATRVAANVLAPLANTALLPWLGLAVVCLCTAGILDELPGVVRLFDRQTVRLLEALH